MHEQLVSLFLLSYAEIVRTCCSCFKTREAKALPCCSNTVLFEPR